MVINLQTDHVIDLKQPPVHKFWIVEDLSSTGTPDHFMLDTLTRE